MRQIYTLGDSHCWHAWLKIPGVVTLGGHPMTMWSFGRDKGYVLGSVPENSIAVFCWGEIDCRNHVHKFQPYKECIDKLVKEYKEAIIQNIDGRDIVPYVFLVVPPARDEVFLHNNSFPAVGTQDERKSYVEYMNSKLKELREFGIGIVDVYDSFCDSDGFLIRSKSDGYVHIADEQPIIEFINREMENL